MKKKKRNQLRTNQLVKPDGIHFEGTPWNPVKIKKKKLGKRLPSSLPRPTSSYRRRPSAPMLLTDRLGDKRGSTDADQPLDDVTTSRGVRSNPQRQHTPVLIHPTEPNRQVGPDEPVDRRIKSKKTTTTTKKRKKKEKEKPAGVRSRLNGQKPVARRPIKVVQTKLISSNTKYALHLNWVSI